MVTKVEKSYEINIRLNPKYLSNGSSATKVLNGYTAWNTLNDYPLAGE
nr:MAG TPA: hypothetical protein [Caudoviricetes sp.]